MAALIQKPIHVDIYCKQELCRLDTKLAWFRIKKHNEMPHTKTVSLIISPSMRKCMISNASRVGRVLHHLNYPENWLFNPAVWCVSHRWVTLSNKRFLLFFFFNISCMYILRTLSLTYQVPLWTSLSLTMENVTNSEPNAIIVIINIFQVFL
jgi:hypothetical protein